MEKIFSRRTVIFILFISFAALLWTFTFSGEEEYIIRQMITRMIEDIKDKMGYDFSVGTIRGGFLKSIILYNVSISQDEKIIFQAKRIKIDYRILYLLFRKKRIREITVYEPRVYITRDQKTPAVSRKLSFLPDIRIDEDKFIEIPRITLVSGKIFLRDKTVLKNVEKTADEEPALNTTIEIIRGEMKMNHELKRIDISAAGSFLASNTTIKLRSSLLLKDLPYLKMECTVKNVNAGSHGYYIFSIPRFKYTGGNFSWNFLVEASPEKTSSIGEVWVNQVSASFVPRGMKKEINLEGMDGKIEYKDEKTIIKSLSFFMNGQRVAVSDGNIRNKVFDIKFVGKDFDIQSFKEQFPDIERLKIESRGLFECEFSGKPGEQKYSGKFSSTVLEVSKIEQFKDISVGFEFYKNKFSVDLQAGYEKGSVHSKIQFEPENNRLSLFSDVKNINFRGLHIESGNIKLLRENDTITIQDTEVFVDDKKFCLSGTVSENRQINGLISFDEGKISFNGTADFSSKDIAVNINTEYALTGTYIFSKILNIRNFGVKEVTGKAHITGTLVNPEISGDTRIENCSVEDISIRLIEIGFEKSSEKLTLTKFFLDADSARLVSEFSDNMLKIFGKSIDISVIGSVLKIFFREDAFSRIMAKLSGPCEFSVVLESSNPLALIGKLRSEKILYNKIPLNETEIIFSYRDHLLEIQKCYIAKLGKIQGSFSPDSIQIKSRLDIREMDDFLKLLGLDFYQTKGRLESDVEFTGTADNMKINGTMTLSNAELNEISIDQANLRFSGNNQEIYIDEFSAYKNSVKIVDAKLRCNLENEQLEGIFEINDVPFGEIANSVSIELKKKFYYNKLRGSVSAQGTVSGFLKHPELKIQLYTQNIVLFGIELENAHASILIGNDVIRILDSEIKKTGQSLVIRGEIPYRNLEQNKINIFAEIPPKNKKSLITIGGAQTSIGEGNVKFHLYGYMKSPKIDGNVEIRGGSLKLSVFSEEIHNVISDITVTDNVVTIKRITGELFDNTLVMQGKIDLTNFWDPEYELELISEKFKFKFPQNIILPVKVQSEAYGTLDVHLILSSQPKESLPKLGGDITAVNSKIFFKDTQSAEIPQLNLPVELALKLNVGNNVWLHSEYLKTELEGTLYVDSSKEKKVDLHGKLVLNKGTFNYLNNNFNIERGHILCQIMGQTPEEETEESQLPQKAEKLSRKYTFNGRRHTVELLKKEVSEEKESKIFVSFHATEIINDVDVYVDVNGSIDDMTMNIWSDPEIDDERLYSLLNRKSYINLFDEQSSQTSTGEKFINLVQNDLQTRFLSGLGENVMKNLNFDNFKISTTADISPKGIDNTVDLNIGKYFEKNLYVKYSREFSREDNEIIGMELKANDTVTWDGELNKREGYRLRLKFKYSF